jgi:hypothetical protein
MNKKYQQVLILSIFASAAFALNATCMNLSRTYDYTVDIKTETVEHYFDYSGSLLGPAVRAAVSYQATGADQTNKYEDLWYHNWNCIGCRRHGELKMHPGQQVAIRVAHKGSATNAEREASANAIIRILLDCYANSNMVAIVYVPDDSLIPIASAMQRASFRMAEEAAPDEPVYAQIQLELRSNSGAKQILHYGGTAQ